MSNFIEFLLPIVALVFHYFLSTRQTNWLGSLLPTFYVLTIIYFIASERAELTFSSFMIFLVGLVALLGVWSKGRNDLKNKQDKEIIKMKTTDIK